MIFHTADNVTVQFDRPSAEAIAWDRAQQLVAFQEIREQLAGFEAAGRRLVVRPAEGPTWRRHAA